MALLFLSTPARGRVWKRLFEQAGQEIILGEAAVTDPTAITHLMCWTPPQDLSLYPNLRVIISAGAGVDHMPDLPPQVVLSRTIAPGIETMVRDWAVMASLMLHRDMPAYLTQAKTGQWADRPVRAATDRRVGIMGAGRIGQLTGATLQNLGFPVAYFSRSGRPIGSAQTFAAHQLNDFLARTDLLIGLLPLTDETQGLMDAGFFDRLPTGGLLVQAGRGAQLHLDALRTALETGKIAGAMFDVTDPEPLPSHHWAWTDPRVIITPHIAAVTDHEEGARHALAVILADQTGAKIPGRIDPIAGY